MNHLSAFCSIWWMMWSYSQINKGHQMPYIKRRSIWHDLTISIKGAKFLNSDLMFFSSLARAATLLAIETASCRMNQKKNKFETKWATKVNICARIWIPGPLCSQTRAPPHPLGTPPAWMVPEVARGSVRVRRLVPSDDGEVTHDQL
jgi:hypothetical protein